MYPLSIDDVLLSVDHAELSVCNDVIGSLKDWQVELTAEGVTTASLEHIDLSFSKRTLLATVRSCLDLVNILDSLYTSPPPVPPQFETDNGDYSVSSSRVYESTGASSAIQEIDLCSFGFTLYEIDETINSFNVVPGMYCTPIAYISYDCYHHMYVLYMYVDSRPLLSVDEKGRYLDFDKLWPPFGQFALFCDDLPSEQPQVL
jgi:hypothetical protein